MRKPKTILLVILVLIGYSLVGCQSQPPPPTLFDTSPCNAPCWQNIVPGDTTEQDALTIFAKFADSKGVTDYKDLYQDGYEDYIRFFPTIGSSTVDVGTFNGRVSMMQFEGVFGGKLILQHAIEQFGEPESVLVEYGTEHYQVTLFNLTKGIAYGWLSPGGITDYDKINPDTEVGSVWFFDLTQGDRFLNAKYNGSGIGIKKQFHPWVGYGSIKNKYWPPAAP